MRSAGTASARPAKRTCVENAWGEDLWEPTVNNDLGQLWEPTLDNDSDPVPVTAEAPRAAGWRWRAMAPSLVTSIPLVGFPLLYDEIKLTIATAHSVRANPLKAAQSVYERTGHYLDRGNFRPLGRFLENMEYSILYEVGEATGLAPHAVHSLFRVAAIALLALVCTRLVAAIMRPAGGAEPPALGLYPLVLAAVLVANGTGSPLVLFPFLLIGSAVVIVGAALLVGRDRDFAAQATTPGAAVVVFLVGAVCAMFYDLAYAAPVVAAAFVAARALASRMPVRQARSTAAVKRLAFLWAGFLSVFVPSRVVIAARCSELDCYKGSDANPSPDALGLIPDRLVTAAPPAGWRYNANLAKTGIGADLAGLGANLLTLLLAVGIVIVAVRAARASAELPVRSDTPALPAEPAHTEPGPTRGNPDWQRTAAGLGLVGLALALPPAAMAALSRYMQQAQPQIGQAWRETLVVQAAWSLLLYAVITAVIGLTGSPAPRKAAVCAVSTALALAMGAALLSNQRLTTAYRQHPVTSITKQMIAATLNDDPTPQGNARRCSLVGDYREIADPPFPIEEHLDQIMLDRYGRPYCEPGNDP